MYDSLLEYFDEIFPIEKSKLDYIEEVLEKSADPKDGQGLSRLLDLGCVNGSLAFQLMRKGLDVTGIDSNTTMIQSACRRNPEPRSHVRFFRMDMRDAGKVFSPNSYTLILCLENILAHLDDLAAVESFLISIRRLLADNGALIIHLVNYERVLAEQMDRLPTIETLRARYERQYTERPDGRLNYEVNLFSASENLVFKDRSVLYPLKAGELEEALEKAGYSKIEFRDSFEYKEFTGTDLSLVCTAWK